MLSSYAFALLFIIVLIISVAAAAMMLLWLAQIEPFKRRKKRMYALNLESEVAMLREEVESLRTLLGTFRTRSEAFENGLFKLQESIQKRKE